MAISGKRAVWTATESGFGSLRGGERIELQLNAKERILRPWSVRSGERLRDVREQEAKGEPVYCDIAVSTGATIYAVLPYHYEPSIRIYGLMTKIEESCPVG